METYFSTPILDEESSGLLKMISEHGGYAYVSMLAQAAAGDTRAAEAAREMAWEQLHSGPWHSVLPVWRDAFSMACLHVARHHCRDGEFKEALRVLDMGVIMGGPLLRKDLDSAIETVSFRARVREGEKIGERAGASSENGRRLVSEEEFDKAELLRILPNRSLSCKIVVKRSGLSLEGFLREYFLSGSPVIITDCMAHWPARTKWNDIDYLKRVAGDRTVPVEVGKNYLCPEWKQELIPFSQFLERIRLTGNSSDVLTYLAQHPLFDQINELRKDICIPDYCFAGGGELRSLNAWFGPVGTVTPLHHDPHHNILAQVVGKKYIRLYPASLLEELYPYTETMLCNSSQISLEALLGEMIWGEGFDDLGKVAANIGSSAMLNFPVHLAASVNGSCLIPAKQKVDLDHIDDSQFPKVNDLDFFDCILNEGEMIYIPPKWWHYVRSLSISLSVSFWWGSDAGGSTSS